MMTKLLLPFLLIGSLSCFGQDDSRSEKKTGIWTLTLPDKEDGPMVFTFNYEYQFTRECVGTSGCHANLTFNVTNIDVVQLSGRYGFRHLGKTYFADIISQYDQRGVAGFDDIVVTSFTMDNLIIYGGEGSERFNMSSSMGSKWKAVKVSQHTDLDKMVLDFTLCRARNVNYTNSTVVKERIANYLRSQSAQNEKPSGNTASQGSAATGFGSSAQTSPATNQGGASAPVSEKVLVNGQYVQVYEQNGVPYMIEPDGRTHETSREVYDYVMNRSNNMRSSQQTSAPAAQVNPVDEPMPDFGTDMQTLEQQRNEAVGELVNTLGNTVNFYAQEARERNAREEERLSREYDQMMAERAEEDQKNQSLIEYRSKRARQIFSHTMYHFNNSEDKSTQDIMHVLLTRNILSAKEGFYSTKTEKYYPVKIDDMLPADPKAILEKAKAENNFDAVLLDCDCLLGIPDNEKLEKLKIIAELGSKDAMIILGDYYDRRKIIRGVETIVVGNDPQQAMYWYSRAAESGCPIGNFKLSRIYRTGATIDDEYLKKYHVKYPVVKNDSAALQYLYSAFSDLGYEASGWSKSLHDFNSQYMVGSLFHPELWYEFAHYTANGISIMVKNEEMAETYREYGDKLKENMKSAQIPEIISSMGFNAAGMYTADNDQCRMAISDDGYTYTIESKKGGNWFSVLPFNLLSQDFELSYIMTKTSGTDDYYFGMILGEHCITHNHHFVGHTGKGQFVTARMNRNSSAGEDLVNIMSPDIVKGNAANAYRIVKIKDELSVYINGTLVSTTKIENLYGNRFGFRIFSGSGNLNVSISNFTFNLIY